LKSCPETGLVCGALSEAFRKDEERTSSSSTGSMDKYNKREEKEKSKSKSPESRVEGRSRTIEIFLFKCRKQVNF
jgi:hypothetical protein